MNTNKVLQFLINPLSSRLLIYRKKQTCVSHKMYAWILSLMILLNGCATLPPHNYEVQTFDQYQYSQVVDGVAIAVEPLTQKEEVEKYFGINLLSKNILPVFIFVENHHNSSSIILLKDQISLGFSETANDFGGQNTSEKVALSVNLLTIMAPGIALISLPFLAGVVSGSNEIEHNILSKELQSDTISPGKNTSGFIYFQLASKEAFQDNYFVNIKALITKSKDLKNFNFEFRNKNKKT